MRTTPLGLLLLAACNAPDPVCPPSDPPGTPVATPRATDLSASGGLRLTYSVTSADTDESAPDRVAEAFRQLVVEYGASSAQVYLVDRSSIVVDIPAGADPKLFEELLRTAESSAKPATVQFESQSVFGPALP
ncbi:MAG: hypothetical protein ACRBN8_05460 [Nannocystales bacterium]